MFLSICIPTYNRAYYLIDTLQDLFKQAIELGVEDEIEICISNNASTDNTKEVLEILKNDYPQFRILLNHNQKNLGPDLNFVKVLEMPTGNYTILKGDDDYFAPNGLEYALRLLKKNPQIDFFISNVDIVDLQRNFVSHCGYLREAKENLIVDFTNEIEARNYFTLCNMVHALGCFISGVIVKTDAFRNVQIDEAFIGTGYAFQYYFWKYLTEGHKMMYSSHVYIQAVVGTDNNWDKGIARDALDISGISFVADYFFKDSSLNQDFKDVANRMYMDYYYIPIDQQKDFKEKMIPALFKSNHPLKRQILRRSSPFYLMMFALLSFFPSSFGQYIRKKITKKC